MQYMHHENVVGCDLQMTHYFALAQVHIPECVEMALSLGESRCVAIYRIVS